MEALIGLLSRLGRGWFNLVASSAVVIIMQVGEDMAEGVPAPGNLTLASFSGHLLIFLFIQAAGNRFVVRPNVPSTPQRFRAYATFGALLCAYFSYQTWAIARGLLLSGMSISAVLQRTAIWLACGVIALLAGIGLACCAWLGSRRDVIQRAESLGQLTSQDERDAEVLKRASQTAFLASMTLLFLLLPLVEVLVLHRYPVSSFAIGGAVGLSWAGAYAYWSFKL